MKLAKKYGSKWEKIGHKMGRRRFDCKKRYSQLFSLPFDELDSIPEDEIKKIKWSKMETSRLYGNFLVF